ncbi:MAG: hypothetical protein LT106_18680 [Burkholderiaceae bacterium]|nr:hypothetical protein [Burkholderiaceae bacterium]
MPSVELIKAVAVTAELCGRTFSDAAAEVFVDDLAGFPEPAVFAALVRCRKEVRGLLTVQDVISRIDDGRPGAEEAWAMLPFDEETTVVWTDEMVAAWSVAQPLLDGGEKVAARMAFKEAYTKAVNEARDARRPPKWSASLGHDPHGRASALEAAAVKGRISLEYAQRIAPQIEFSPEAIRLIEAAKVALLPNAA